MFNLSSISKKYKLAFCIILFLQLCLLFYCMNKKEVLFIDEVYSYTIANSRIGWLFFDPKVIPTPSIACWNEWLNGKFLFENFLAVSQANKFDYCNTLKNMLDDTHPPLYYYFIHTVCSFFPGEFSKWHGLVPNVLFFIISQILVFFITRHFCDEKFSLFACLIYGFSASALSNFLYIRMYAMVTVFFLALLYLYLLYADNKMNFKRLLALFAVIFLGSLTHYHFLVYAFFATLVFIIICAKNKSYKNFWLFSMTALLGVVAAYWAFPTIVSQINNSPRVTEAGNFIGNILSVLGGFAFTISKQFGLGLNLSLIISGISFLFCIVAGFLYIVKKSTLAEYTDKLCIVFIPTLLFLLIISPSINYVAFGAMSYRFFIPIYPIITIILAIILEKKINNKYLISVIIMLSLFSCLNENAIPMKSAEAYSDVEKKICDKNVVFYSFQDFYAQSAVPLIVKCKNSYLVPRNSHKLPDFVNSTIKPDLIITPFPILKADQNLMELGEINISDVDMIVYSYQYN